MKALKACSRSLAAGRDAGAKTLECLCFSAAVYSQTAPSESRRCGSEKGNFLQHHPQVVSFSVLRQLSSVKKKKSVELQTGKSMQSTFFPPINAQV